jgi:V8-like Glu-specific endopeptidase
MVDGTHFITAAHCVYDPSLGGWAQSHEVILGQNGTYRPYGTVYATYQRTFNGYINGQNPNSDMALLTLGSAVGNSTGWFGMQVKSNSWFAGQPTINSAGYPADIGGNTRMYRIAGPVSSATADRIYYTGTMDTFGGQSGSALWSYNSSTGQRHIVGVHTTGYSTYNGGTRLSQAKFDAIVGWMRTDNGGRTATLARSGLISETVSLGGAANRSFVAQENAGKMETIAAQINAAAPDFQATVGMGMESPQASLLVTPASKTTVEELAFQDAFRIDVKTPSTELALPALAQRVEQAASDSVFSADLVSGYRKAELPLELLN